MAFGGFAGVRLVPRVQGGEGVEVLRCSSDLVRVSLLPSNLLVGVTVSRS